MEINLPRTTSGVSSTDAVTTSITTNMHPIRAPRLVLRNSSSRGVGLRAHQTHSVLVSQPYEQVSSPRSLLFQQSQAVHVVSSSSTSLLIAHRSCGTTHPPPKGVGGLRPVTPPIVPAPVSTVADPRHIRFLKWQENEAVRRSYASRVTDSSRRHLSGNEDDTLNDRGAKSENIEALEKEKRRREALGKVPFVPHVNVEYLERNFAADVRRSLTMSTQRLQRCRSASGVEVHLGAAPSPWCKDEKKAAHHTARAPEPRDTVTTSSPGSPRFLFSASTTFLDRFNSRPASATASVSVKDALPGVTTSPCCVNEGEQHDNNTSCPRDPHDCPQDSLHVDHIEELPCFVDAASPWVTALAPYEAKDVLQLAFRPGCPVERSKFAPPLSRVEALCTLYRVMSCTNEAFLERVLYRTQDVDARSKRVSATVRTVTSTLQVHGDDGPFQHQLFRRLMLQDAREFYVQSAVEIERWYGDRERLNLLKSAVLDAKLEEHRIDNCTMHAHGVGCKADDPPPLSQYQHPQQQQHAIILSGHELFSDIRRTIAVHMQEAHIAERTRVQSLFFASFQCALAARFGGGRFTVPAQTLMSEIGVMFSSGGPIRSHMIRDWVAGIPADALFLHDVISICVSLCSGLVLPLGLWLSPLREKLQFAVATKAMIPLPDAADDVRWLLAIPPTDLGPHCIQWMCCRSFEALLMCSSAETREALLQHLKCVPRQTFLSTILPVVEVMLAAMRTSSPPPPQRRGVDSVSGAVSPVSRRAPSLPTSEVSRMGSFCGPRLQPSVTVGIRNGVTPPLTLPMVLVEQQHLSLGISGSHSITTSDQLLATSISSVAPPPALNATSVDSPRVASTSSASLLSLQRSLTKKQADRLQQKLPGYVVELLQEYLSTQKISFRRV
jgi:hypothetical protein